jgi:ATP-dependent protease ClpP protease subunit
VNLAALRGLTSHRSVIALADSDTLQIDLYGIIGWDIWTEDLMTEIGQSTATAINVMINSPGGDAFGGIALYNALAGHPATVVVDIQGLAASAASIVAMAGNSIIMHPGSTMMIHDAIMYSAGNAAKHRKDADSLDKISDGIASVYATRAGGEVTTWRQAMLDETWLTSDEAITAGLATRVETGSQLELEDSGATENPDEETASLDAAVRGLFTAGWRWKDRAHAPPPTKLIAALARPVPDQISTDSRVAALRAALADYGGNS